MKYTVKIEIEAVLLIDKDPDSIREISKILDGIPYHYNDTGIIFSDDDEIIKYGNYIVKEAHGISVMSKEAFNKMGAEPVIDEVVS